MRKTFLSRAAGPAVLLSLALLCACDPTFNWREVHGKEAPFTVLLPAKPATLARPITLGGKQVTMTMTAAEVGRISFAVGVVQYDDARQAHAALHDMQTALVGNINGTINDKPAGKPKQTASDAGDAIDVEARGVPQAGAEPMLLVGHFVADGKRAYQVIVLGPEKEMDREQSATFIASFKPN